MRKGRQMLLFALMIGVIFVMTSCGNGNTNGTTAGTNETATNVGNGSNVETVPNTSTGANQTENGTDGGVLTNLGDDIMNGVDEFATDMGIENGTNNSRTMP